MRRAPRAGQAAPGQHRPARRPTSKAWPPSASGCATRPRWRPSGTTCPGLADAFGPYRRALADAGAVDFDEQIYGAVEVLLADGEFRRRAQQGCRHLLVDEFQDLTPAHVLLLRLLAAPGLDVFGVGDDDQCIYGYVGRRPRPSSSTTSGLFPGAASHPLEVNYRCPAAVVDGAPHPAVVQPPPGGQGDPPRARRPSRRPEALEVAPPPRPRRARPRWWRIVRRGWTRTGSSPADGRRAHPGQRAPARPPRRPRARPASRWPRALGPDVLERTGVRAALAYLRIGADPTAIDARRPGGGHAPAQPGAAAVVPEVAAAAG